MSKKGPKTQQKPPQNILPGYIGVTNGWAKNNKQYNNISPKPHLQGRSHGRKN